jgi:hypothetical protein
MFSEESLTISFIRGLGETFAFFAVKGFEKFLTAKHAKKNSTK